ncbi:MAG: LicD family protein [Sulfurimonas sp.]|nr:LicD family protein [Sulfurimonas sp.]
MKNIIIFGAGEFGKDAYRFYQAQSNVNIIAYSDNNSDIHNTTFFDIQIIPPSEISNLNYDEVAIASSFDDEIYKQLLSINIDKNKINILNLNKIKVQLKGDRLSLAQELMFDIAELFNKENISYHIDHGTLLGIIRDKSLMPWDIDVDFAVLAEDKNIIINTLEIFLKTYSSQYCTANNWKCSIHNCKMTLNKQEEELPMVIKVFNQSDDKTSNSFFVDIELKYQHNNHLYWMVGSRKLSSPQDICFPSSSFIFKDKKLKVPKKTKQYLTLLYGDWMKVVKEWSYDRYANIKDN